MPLPDVLVRCHTCDVERELPADDPAELSAALARFFTVHEACSTTIDLQGGQLPPVVHRPDLVTAEPPRPGLLRGLAERRKRRRSSTADDLQVRLLGTFAVLRDGVPVALPEPAVRQAIAYIALAGGRAPVEVVADALWPGGAGAARTRLRAVLEPDGGVLAWDGEELALPPGTRIDARTFLREAESALAPSAPEEAALRAVELHLGELLPEDRDQDWLAAPRERVHVLHVQLLDRLIERATARDDVDGAVRWYERAAEADPIDEQRHLAVARLLMTHGRTVDARRVARRAVAVLEGLGVAPVRELRQLQRCSGD